MYDGKRVSMVFSAYNEVAGIGRAVEEFLTTCLVDEVVVVDNGDSKITGNWKGTLKTGFNMTRLILRYRFS